MTTYCEACESPADALRIHATPSRVMHICGHCYCALRGFHDSSCVEHGWDFERQPVQCLDCGEDAPTDIAQEVRQELQDDIRDEAELNAEYVRDQMEAL